MSAKRVSTKRPLAADIVGLPTRQLADMLDEILAEQKGAPPPSGLFGMAEMARLGLSLPAGEADDGPLPDEGGEDLIPELRIVQALLAHIPRAPDPPDPDKQRVAAPDHPAPTGEIQTLPDPSVLAEGYDLDAIRRALQAFAGEPLPDAVFDEVVDITAELAGKPKPVREITPLQTAEPLATTEPLDDADRGDRLLAEIKAIQASLAEDGYLIAAPPTEIAPLPEPIPPPEPMPVIEGAPPEPAPEPVPPQPATEQRQVKAKPARQRKAAPPPPAEEIIPLAEPAPTLPEPVAEVRPFKVKVKPARPSKGAPAQPAETAPQPAEAAPAEPPAEPAQPAEASTQAAEPEPPVAPMMAEAPVPQPEPDVPPADDDDVLLLTEDLAVPASEVPDFAEAAVAMDDAGFATAAQVEVIAEPMSPSTASPVDAPEPVADADASAARGDVVALIEAIIAAHRPTDAPDGAVRGDGTLPERVEVLEFLLADPPPANDFIALDLLAECWGKGAHAIPSRALLAVAQNLSRNFGLPGKLPMASSKAWKMLDPEVFQEELAHRLIAIGAFISDWQRTQRTFLILEFGEIELVEHLFEALRPADYLDLLADVMNFKVLSNRRMGLLRRIPNRVRKQVQPMLPDRAEEALVLLAHTKALLEKLADPNGFTPIVDAATKALEEIEKLMKLAAAATAPPQLPGPPGAGGGMALGRIGA